MSHSPGDEITKLHYTASRLIFVAVTGCLETDHFKRRSINSGSKFYKAKSKKLPSFQYLVRLHVSKGEAQRASG